MKKNKSLLMLSALFLLAACSQQSSQEAPLTGGNKIFEDVSSSVDSAQASSSEEESGEQVSYSEDVHRLVAQVSQAYRNLKSLKMTVDTTVKNDALNYFKSQSNHEQYGAGTLQRSYSEVQTKVDNETFLQSFYSTTEEDGKMKLYIRTNAEKWQESGARKQTLYIDFIKYLLEGKDEVTLAEDQPILTKKITDAEQVKTLTAALDIPVWLSPNAQYDLTMHFHVDEATGHLSNVMVEGSITDLGQTYEVSVVAFPTPDEKFEAVKVNLEEASEPLKVEEGKFLEQFQAANLTKAVTFYDMVIGNTHYEDENVSLVSLSVWGNTIPFAKYGKIVEQEVKDETLIYANKRYFEKAGQVTSEDFPIGNYYADSVAKFIASYDVLTLLEEEEEAEEGEEKEESDTYRYRHLFEADVEGFKEAAGAVDISGILRDEEAHYGIEYLIDKKTLRLSSVYYWSVIASDESIGVVKTLHFHRFNQYNPNFLEENIPQAVWDSIK
ncbi:MAG: hypothetical protein Q4B80_04960 [Aerococcaceae bacterium]|nr:hypothetical protein [Aerococcaceae bacterium]